MTHFFTADSALLEAFQAQSGCTRFLPFRRKTTFRWTAGTSKIPRRGMNYNERITDSEAVSVNEPDFEDLTKNTDR